MSPDDQDYPCSSQHEHEPECADPTLTAPAARGQLRFGYNGGLPDSVTTAWGCRAIVNPEGTVDVVSDRTDLFGPRADVLAAKLDDLMARDTNWRYQAQVAFRIGVLHVGTDGEALLWDDGTVVIKANPKASHGYLYVCAYLADEASA
jgi:hypothetical protein